MQLGDRGYQLPEAQVLPAAAAARVTDSAVGAFVRTAEALLPELLGGGPDGTVCLDVDALLGSGVDLSLELGPLVGGVGARNVSLCVDISGLAVELVPGGDGARVRIRLHEARVSLKKPAVVYGAVEVVGFEPDAACLIDNELGGSVTPPHLAVITLDVVATIRFDEASSLHITMDTGDLVIHQVGVSIQKDCSLAECTDPNPAGIGDPCFECEVCRASDFGSDLVELAVDLIGETLTPLLAPLVDAAVGALLEHLLADQPLGVAARVTIGNFLGAVTSSARTAQDVGVLLRPAPAGLTVAEGTPPALELRIEGGTAPEGLHTCVGVPGPAPSFGAVAFPVFPDTLDDGSKYDVAIALSEPMINQALWSGWLSGALCLSLTTDEAARLTDGLLDLRTGALDLLIPGVAAMAGRTAAVRVSLRPRLRAADFPIVRLLEGAPARALLAIPEVEVGIEAFVDGDYMRVVTVTAGVRAKLSLEFGARRGLIVGLDDVEVTGAQVTSSAAFAPADLDGVVSLALDLALGALGQLGPLALSFDPTALLGALPAEVEVLSIRPLGTPAAWLAAFLRLGDGASPSPGGAP